MSSQLNNLLGVKDENASLIKKTYFLFFSSGMMVNVLGSLLPYMGDDYGFSYTFRGTLSSVNQIGNLIAVWLTIFLPSLIGRKNSTVCLSFLIVIGLIMIAGFSSPLFVLLAFLFVGLGRGAVTNHSNTVVGRYAQQKGVALNILHASFALGAVSSPIVIMFLGGERWKNGALLVALVMCFAIVMLQCSSLDNKRGRFRADRFTLPRSFDFWLSTFIIFFYLCGEYGFSTWLVTYFRDTGIFSHSISNITASLLWIMILLGRLLTASLVKRWRKSLLLLFMGIGMFLFYLLMIASEAEVLIVFALLGVGFFMGGIYPTTLATMEKRYTDSPITMGLSLAVATLGGIAMQMVIGGVAEHYGIAFGMATISLALSFMLILMIIKAGRKEV